MGIAVLALALAVPAPARAQAPFPVPVPASVVLVPLLLLVLPIGIELSRTESARVRLLESRRDWPGLVALATRELEQQPGEARWLSVRGRAWQRLGRCEPALADLKPLLSAPPAQDGARPGSARGIDALPADLRTAIGDAVRACEDWLAVQDGTPGPSSLTLQIGPRSLALPGTGWTAIAPPAPEPVGGASSRSMLVPGASGGVPVTVRAAIDWAPDGSGRVAGALVWSGNPRQAYGVQVWSADRPCGQVPEALAAETFGSGVDAPECLLLRRTGAEGPRSPALSGVRAEAATRGADGPASGYELRYARYGVDWLVTLDAWIPAHRLPSDAVAVLWARALAERLHALGAPPASQVVELPPLGRP